MAVPKKFHFSTHARIRGAERQITEAQFIEVVTTSNRRFKQFVGTHGGFVYRYEKSIHGMKLTIVAETFKDECFFITGFWE
jgi:hypothetical protein